MKILFVTDLYNVDDNSDSFALNNFVEEWQRQGHQVFVVRPNFLLNTILRKKKISSEKQYFQNGVNILNLNFLTPFLFNVNNKLPDDFNISDFDVVISHMPSGTLFTKRLLEKNKIPFCASVHCSDIEVLSNPVYSFFFKKQLFKAYQMCDFISPRSYCLKEKIKNFVNEEKKSFVAFSGIDEKNIISEDDLSRKISDYNTKGKFIITTVANLKKRKNVDLVIKALSNLKNIDFEYRIIGDGEEFNNLKYLSSMLDLNGKVKFYGKQSKETVISLLKESDIFVLPSKNETFGIAYLEALATGNIVVCTKNDGIDGIIKDSENGFLTELTPQYLTKVFNTIFSLSSAEISQILNNSRNTILNYTTSRAAQNYISNIDI